jgi:hypothetical protein
MKSQRAGDVASGKAAGQVRHHNAPGGGVVTRFDGDGVTHEFNP